MISNKRIVFVYDLLHPLHVKFMKSVGCDFTPLSQKIPKKYEIYIVEGTYIKPILMRKIGKISRDKKIVTLISDPRLFYLSIGKKFDFKREIIVKYPKFRSLIAKRLLKELDGVICTSELTASLFRKFNKKSPLMITPGFVFKESFKKISKIKPNLSNKNILFIGYGPDFYCKGLDLLIESFKEVKKKIPDANLYILGRWKIKKEWVYEGVHFEGEQNVLHYLKKCSLSVHLGRGEAFGINILETMLAGIPTLVSEYTGAKQVVKIADKKLVIPLKRDIVVKRVVDYFKSSLNYKERLSKKCKKTAKEFNEEKILKEFKKNFTGFIKQIRN